MNLNLKDLRISSQALIITGGFLLLSLINFFIIRHHKNSLKEDAEIIKYVGQIQLDYEKMVQLVERHYQGEESLEYKISELSNTYGRTVEVFESGGILPKSDHYIDALKSPLDISVGKIKTYWDLQLKHLNTYLYPESNTIEQTDSTSSNQMIITSEEGYQYFIRNSDYFQTTSQELIKGLMINHQAKQRQLDHVLIIFIIANIAFISLIIFLAKRKFFSPLQALSELSDKVSAGQLSEKSDYSKNNELGDISQALNKLIDNLRNATAFVKEIGSGNLDTEFTGVDEKSVNEGSLQASLLNMRSEMKQLEVNESERKWSTEGLAKFVDILRSTDSDVKALSDTIISNLIDYTKSNQGAIYLLNGEDEENKFLELIALYAFDNKKFEEQSVKFGEGLVGQTYLEKKTIYLLEIPDDYITITSGLGGANPKAILLVPLLVNEEIYGVIELASFYEYQPHEIEFVEKLAESIASTISGVKNNELTRKLLEESQELTEQMQAQEEEMRQNMEELTATQEEMNRKARETEQLLQESQERTKFIEVLVEIAQYDAKDCEELLDFTINTIGDLLDWPVGHVYFTEHDDEGIKLVPSSIWKGEESSEFKAFKSTTENSIFRPGIGLPGTVYEQRSSHWINDIVTDPNFPRAKQAAALDLHSAFGFPILIEGKAKIVVEFFTKQAVETDESLMYFMDQVGGLMGNLIKKLDQTVTTEGPEDLSEMEEELRQNLDALEVTQEQLNSKLFNMEEKLYLMDTSVALILCNSNGQVAEINTRAAEFIGLAEGEIKDKNIEELINNYDPKLLVSEGAHEVEIKTNNGTLLEVKLKTQFSKNTDAQNRFVHLIWL